MTDDQRSCLASVLRTPYETAFWPRPSGRNQEPENLIDRTVEHTLLLLRG